MLSGWEFFKIHKALDLHFHDEKYDVIKYNGAINVNPEAYGVRNDQYRFDYYGNKFFNKTKAAHFCIANFVGLHDNFVYAPYEDAENYHLHWRRIQESISKVFGDDLRKIKDRAGDMDLFSKTKSGNLPPIVQMIKARFITFETAAILEREVQKFLTTSREMCNNDPYMSRIMLICEKYVPFVNYDKAKINQIAKELKF